MAKKDYEEMSKQILEFVGGKSNISSCIHCATRLRFMVKDKGLVKKEKIDEINGVLGSQWIGDQYQIIVGKDVENVYVKICKLGDILQEEALNENLDGKLINGNITIKSLFKVSLEKLSSIVAPLIPVFCAGGMIKCLVTVLTSLNIVASDSSIIAVINAIGDAPFYFMPFLMGYTSAKAFGLKEVFGIMFAGILMYPTILNQTLGETIEFGILSIPSLNYSTTAFPIILCIFLFSYFYRFVDKIIPKNLDLIFTGLISFCIFTPFALTFIAPLGTYLSVGVAEVIMYLFELCGPVAGGLYSSVLSFFIMTGLHINMIPIIIQNIELYGMDYLIVATFVNNIAVAGSTLGYALTIKNKEMKSMGISTGLIALCGISEPALYGVGVKYRKPFIGNVLGGAVGGALFMFFGVTCSAFAFQSIFSIPLYTRSTQNLVGLFISLVATFIVSFVVSYVVGKRHPEEN